MTNVTIPPYDAFMNPIIQALKLLGGSGTIEEITNKVAEIVKLSDKQLEQLHNPEKSSQTEVEYRLAWARTYLKKYGILENSSRGIWSLTSKGQTLDQVDLKTVKRFITQLQKQKHLPSNINDLDEIAPELSWKEDVLDILLKIEPSAFERLVQRLLRESGFTQVEVTGKSGDGGIDGKGIMRLGGLLSFHVIFQCKRYSGSVTASQVRDFRGAMEGRADKGLIVTTGNFTKEALREATRDGARAIDLIDGDQLVEKLKELGLGIWIEKIEKVQIDRDWFNKF